MREGELVDLSHAVEAGMITYPGLPGPVIRDHLSREASRGAYAEGVTFQIGAIDMVANTGTYVDAPFHRFEKGIDLAGLPLERVAALEGTLVDAVAMGGRAIGPAAFDGAEVRGRAILVRTGWDAHWRTERYGSGHPFLTAGAADRLVEGGAALVGIDSLNIDDTADRARPVHSRLLQAGIPVVEHLCNLGALAGRAFRFFAVPAPVRGMGSFPVRAFARIGVALALALLPGCGAGEEQPQRPTFDGQAAMQLVERQVAFGPRVPGTPAHDEALAWLVDTLGALADTVVVEPFTHVTTAGDTLRLSNVVASFSPSAPSRVLLAAHWDTRPVAEKDPDPERRDEPIPGANDGASGVAVLLEVARALHAQPLAEPYGVDILLLDGEDYGHDPRTFGTRAEDMYLGAKEYARAHADDLPLFAILIDLVGDKEPRFPKEGYSLDYAPEVVRRVWGAAADLGYSKEFPDRSRGYVTDDHFFLNQAGIRTVDIIDLDYPEWHTHADTPAAMSAASLDAVGEVLLEVLYNRL